MSPTSSPSFITANLQNFPTVETRSVIFLLCSAKLFLAKRTSLWISRIYFARHDLTSLFPVTTLSIRFWLCRHGRLRRNVVAVVVADAVAFDVAVAVADFVADVVAIVVATDIGTFLGVFLAVFGAFFQETSFQ
jgi:hypothetical protein